MQTDQPADIHRCQLAGQFALRQNPTMPFSEIGKTSTPVIVKQPLYSSHLEIKTVELQDRVSLLDYMNNVLILSFSIQDIINAVSVWNKVKC